MMMSLKITSPTWIWVRVKIVIPRSYKSNNSAQLFIVRMRFSAESIIISFILSTILATPLL